MNKEDLQKELFAYVKENTYKETGNLTADTKLFVEGIFDSMGFALLLDHLEESYKIAAEDDDLVEENFESIDTISAFILKKKRPLMFQHMMTVIKKDQKGLFISLIFAVAAGVGTYYLASQN